MLMCVLPSCLCLPHVNLVPAEVRRAEEDVESLELVISPRVGAVTEPVPRQEQQVLPSHLSSHPVLMVDLFSPPAFPLSVFIFIFF